MSDDKIAAIGDKSERRNGNIGISFGQPSSLLNRTEIPKDAIDIINGANTPNKRVNLTNNIFSCSTQW
ncbi:hypothetical protein IKQ21_02075 [bacterium]|nr:hypothetical protein [bacterium]